MDPNFIKLVDKVKAIHEAKNHDYATDNDPHSNFKFTEDFIKLFGDDMPKWCLPYLSLIGTKLARLRELLKGKQAKNESIEDSFVDLIAYCGLWGARHQYVVKNIPQLSGTLHGLGELFSNKQPPAYVCANCKRSFSHEPMTLGFYSTSGINDSTRLDKSIFWFCSSDCRDIHVKEQIRLSTPTK